MGQKWPEMGLKWSFSSFSTFMIYARIKAKINSNFFSGKLKIYPCNFSDFLHRIKTLIPAHWGRISDKWLQCSFLEKLCTWIFAELVYWILLILCLTLQKCKSWKLGKILFFEFLGWKGPKIGSGMRFLRIFVVNWRKYFFLIFRIKLYQLKDWKSFCTICCFFLFFVFVGEVSRVSFLWGNRVS